MSRHGDKNGTVHVEVVLDDHLAVNAACQPTTSREATSPGPDIQALIIEHVHGCYHFYPSSLAELPLAPTPIPRGVKSISVEEIEGGNIENSFTSLAMKADLDIHIHTYRFQSDPPRCPSPMFIDDEDRYFDYMRITTLPHTDLDSSWSSLCFDGNIHIKLLHYLTRLVGSQQKTSNLANTILLHGPAGTGKTSLCRALAQKVAVRNSHTSATSMLVEINASGLLSRFIGQSQKQVSSAFEKIEVLAARPASTCFVLIDEVESIAADRKDEIGRATGNREALRATNRLLTLVDSLKGRSNIILLFTSNLLDILDPAFITRIGITRHIPLPGIQARYTILQQIFTAMIKERTIESSANFTDNQNLVSKGYGPSKDAELDFAIYLKASKLDPPIACHELTNLGREMYPQPIRSFVKARGLLHAAAPCLTTGVMLLAICTQGLCGRTMELVGRTSIELSSRRPVPQVQALGIAYDGLTDAMGRTK